MPVTCSYVCTSMSTKCFERGVKGSEFVRFEAAVRSFVETVLYMLHWNMKGTEVTV